MAKLLAALSVILSVSETALGVKWLTGAKENDWDPKRIFYGIVWLVNAVMHILMAIDLLSQDGSEEDVDFEDADLDGLDGYED